MPSRAKWASGYLGTWVRDGIALLPVSLLRGRQRGGFGAEQFESDELHDVRRIGPEVVGQRLERRGRAGLVAGSVPRQRQERPRVGIELVQLGRALQRLERVRELPGAVSGGTGVARRVRLKDAPGRL